MLELVISLIVIAIIVIAILYIISIWIYKRAPSNMGFIRTGFLGTKICLGKGAIVLPVFHEISWISLETIKFAVSRAREQAILTADNIRVDVITELYAHVGHTDHAVLTASRTLGEKTFDAEKVRNLLEAKVVGALRSYAATKTLRQLHENRDAFAREIKEDVSESFAANGLMLEEVTIVALEQSTKEYFRSDNVFDAEGLKVITEITSEARRKVHTTEKQTTVAIRNKDLTTQLELLEIERQEAVALASQDKEVANEQAKQLREKQTFVLDQRLAVEQKELENEKTLEQLRTERDIAVTAEAKRREIVQVQKELALEQERIQRSLAIEKAEKDREIELIDKAREAEIAEISRNLARERAQRDKDIDLAAKERERQEAEIARATAVAAAEERARDQRHMASEETALAVRRRSLETRLGILDVDRDEAVALAKQEKDISDERARILSEQQRFVLDRRWEVEQEEIRKQQALETAQIQKDIAIIEEATQREAAEIRRELARQQEEMSRDIALISKEGERERTDIERFLAREQAERDREIALAAKMRELEIAETKRLASTAERERAEHTVESVRVVADAERARQVEVIEAGKEAEARRIEEESKAAVMRMHMITQSEARKLAAELEAEATLTRARATTEAQKIGAEGIEREAGARGRAEMEVDQLRIANTQRQLEAEATGIEAKAEALKKYNEAATFLELARLRIEADRDVHIDQAKAMGSALAQAQIRMYGGGDGTVDTIRGLFTQGFGIGEVLEGITQSMPEGLRQRLSANGIQGLLGRQYNGGSLKQTYEHLNALVQEHLRTKKAREVPFPEAMSRLGEHAGENTDLRQAIKILSEFNQEGALDNVPFDSVWNMINAVAKSAG